MHRGYTLNYFIDFFQNIAPHRWTTGTLQEGETVQKCALGHALTDNRTGEVIDESVGNARAEALQSFLDGTTELINDGSSGFDHLGKTPRTRILRALRNRKRTGNVDGETS